MERWPQKIKKREKKARDVNKSCEDKGENETAWGEVRESRGVEGDFYSAQKEKECFV